MAEAAGAPAAQGKSADVEEIELVVPEGKAAGDEIVIQYQVEGANYNATVVVPVDLSAGDVFRIPNPARFVSVHGRTASVSSVGCGTNCRYCGPYDEQSCVSKDAPCLKRFSCFIASPLCCGTLLVCYFMVALVMANNILTIINDGGEWPTTSVQGDLDPSDIYTLQGWAFDEFESFGRDSVSEWELGGQIEEEDEDNSTEIQQTRANGAWSLIVIYRARGEFGDEDRNLLTPEGIQFMKDVQDELLASVPDAGAPTFEDVCLKRAVNASIFASVEDITNETELECALPSSPLSYYYASQVQDSVYEMFGDRYFDINRDPDIVGGLQQYYKFMVGQTIGDFVFLTANSSALLHNYDLVTNRTTVEVSGDTVLLFDGRGTEMAPCGLAESEIAYVAEQSEDFLCIFDQLTTMDEAAMQGIAFDILYADRQLTTAQADSLGNPYTTVSGNESEGRPEGFCSQCYSQSCICSRDQSSDGASVQDRIDSISKVMASTPFLSFYFGSEFSETNLESGVVLLQASFGAPLEGYDSADQGENTSFFDPPGPQTTEFKEWAQSAYAALDQHGATSDSEIEVIYFWTVALADITLDLLIHDVLLVIGSVAFIFFYMWFHTRSCCMASMGLIHIFSSIPIAFLIYTYVFQIEPFYILSFLSVYVILAIGADDVFVMVDAWKQMAHLPPSERMGKAFARASKAMGITSATTAAAFLATASSPLLDVSTFGLYTACLVIANYVSVITYFLGVIMFYHLYIEYCCCCAPRHKSALPKRQCCEVIACGEANRRRQLKMRLEDEVYNVYVAARIHHDPATLKPLQQISPSDDDGDEDLNKQKVHDVESGKQSGGPPRTDVALSKLDENEPRLPILEQFCGEKFFNFMEKGYARYIFPAILIVFAVVMAWAASNLGPTTQADAFLPSWHPVQRFLDVYETDFGTSSEAEMKVISIVFGLDPEQPMDRSEFGRYELEMGPLTLYDDSCDFSTPALQEALWDVCEEFSTLTPAGNTGTDDDEEFLVRQGSGLGELELNCWIRQFKPWFEENYGESFPCERDDCVDIMLNFTTTYETVLSNEDYSGRLWVDDGRLVGTSIAVNGTVGYYSVVYSDVKRSFDAWNDWTERNLAEHEQECMRSAFHVAEDRDKAWVFLKTQDLLMSGAFIGTGTSLAVAFVVLWLATGNLLVTAAASLCMLCVTVCIMGMMYVLGWELGTIESISAVILVGLSVDYVVHIAQAYVEAKAIDRRDRVRGALYEMGSTVFGGAITSLGASGMLFGCWLQYFFKFGGFMFLTIGLSFMFCFFFFIPLMLICGPNRTLERDGKLYDCGSLQAAFKYGGMDPPQGYVFKDGSVHGEANDTTEASASSNAQAPKSLEMVEVQSEPQKQAEQANNSEESASEVAKEEEETQTGADKGEAAPVEGTQKVE